MGNQGPQTPPKNRRTSDDAPTTTTCDSPQKRRNSIQYPALQSAHTAEGNEDDGGRRPGNLNRSCSYDQPSSAVAMPPGLNTLRPIDNGYGDGPNRPDYPSRQLSGVDHSPEDSPCSVDYNGWDGRPDDRNQSRRHEEDSQDTPHGIPGRCESQGSPVNDPYGHSYNAMDIDRGSEAQAGCNVGRGNASDHGSDRPGGQPAQKLLCVVCKRKPQIKHYPICGRKCRDINAQSEAGRGDSRQICVVCGIRPRHAPYPTCGMTCAKLKESSERNPRGLLDSSQGQQGQHVADLIRSDTYSACLMCWSATQQPPSNFCSTGCDRAAQRSTPTLLEAPRGHVTFQEISDLFKNAWKSSRPCPEVLMVYKIVQNRDRTMMYEEYCIAHANSNKERRWHGTLRQCKVGNPDEEDFCDSLQCLLCQTVSHSFENLEYESGVQTSSTSSQWSIYSDSNDSTEVKTMLLTDVCFGNMVLAAPDEIPVDGAKNCDTVQIINSGGQKGDVIVCNKNAIRPSFLVFYC